MEDSTVFCLLQFHMIGAEFQSKIIPVYERRVFLSTAWLEQTMQLSFMKRLRGEGALGSYYSRAST